MVVAVVDVSPLRVLCVGAILCPAWTEKVASVDPIMTEELENPAVFPVGLSGDCGV